MSELSLHYMKNVTLQPDEHKIKDVQLLKTKFPQEYPGVNHPSTVLLVKSMGSGKAIEAKFMFPNSLVENKLQVGASLNNIEMIMSLSQLKGIMRFINDIDAYVKRNPLNRAKLTKNKVDVEDLDLYGTLIMERKRDSPALIKSKSSNTKPKTPPLTHE